MAKIMPRAIALAVLWLASGVCAAQQKPILTPRPAAEPRLNGPKVYGCRPGKPFLYRVACTGARPMRFAARDLPAGLELNDATGIISGRAPAQPGEFTVNVLCNPEVIEVDQDSLGRQAQAVVMDEQTWILAKPMEDGSLAVGLLNLSDAPREITAAWPVLGLSGPQRVRDLWRQTSLGEIDKQYQATVARHGVALVRLWPQREGKSTRPGTVPFFGQ